MNILMRPIVYYFLLIFCGCLAAVASTIAIAEEQTETCQPLATLFGEVICPEDLEQDMPAKTIMGAAAGMAPEQEAHASAEPTPEALRAEIWRRALIHKFGADALTIDDAELIAFRQIFRTETDRSYETDKVTAALLEAYLDSNAYAEPYRIKMTKLLETTKTSIASFEKKKEHASTVPAHMQFISSEVEKAVASQMLRRWKEDKILFQDYGGRLARLPDRLLPVDAYRKFYSFMVDEGALEITAPGLRDLFAHLEAEPDLKFLPEADPLYKNYFTDASWQFRITADSDRLVILEDWLKSLPVKEGTEEQ